MPPELVAQLMNMLQTQDAGVAGPDVSGLMQDIYGGQTQVNAGLPSAQGDLGYPNIDPAGITNPVFAGEYTQPSIVPGTDWRNVLGMGAIGAGAGAAVGAGAGRAISGVLPGNEAINAVDDEIKEIKRTLKESQKEEKKYLKDTKSEYDSLEKRRNTFRAARDQYATGGKADIARNVYQRLDNLERDYAAGNVTRQDYNVRKRFLERELDTDSRRFAGLGKAGKTFGPEGSEYARINKLDVAKQYVAQQREGAYTERATTRSPEAVARVERFDRELSTLRETTKTGKSTVPSQRALRLADEIMIRDGKMIAESNLAQINEQISARDARLKEFNQNHQSLQDSIDQNIQRRRSLKKLQGKRFAGKAGAVAALAGTLLPMLLEYRQQDRFRNQQLGLQENLLSPSETAYYGQTDVNFGR